MPITVVTFKYRTYESIMNVCNFWHSFSDDSSTGTGVIIFKVISSCSGFDNIKFGQGSTVTFPLKKLTLLQTVINSGSKSVISVSKQAILICKDN